MSLRRRSRPQVERTPLLIVCEGELETSYFNALRRHKIARARYALDIRCANGGRHPKVLEIATRYSKNRETWCIFDAESDGEHAAVESAINKCSTRHFHFGLSNPCFNVWALAHLPGAQVGRTTPDKSRRELELALGGNLRPRDIDWVLERILGGEHFTNLERAINTKSINTFSNCLAVLTNNPSTSVAGIVTKLTGV